MEEQIMNEDAEQTTSSDEPGEPHAPEPFPPAYGTPPGGWQAWEQQRPGQPPRREGQRRFPWYIPVIGGCLVLLMIPVVLLAVLAGIAGGLVLFSQEVSATTTQSFAVAGVPTIVLHGNAASVHLISGEAHQVTVRTTKAARGLSRAAAQSELNAMAVNATQTGDTITVTVTWPDLGWFPNYTRRSLDITMTVPSATNVSAELNAGDFHIEGITGNLGVQANAGNLELEQVTFTGASSIGGNAGSVDCTCALATGASLDVHLNAGHVALMLPANTQAHLDASVNAGNISIDGWPITPTRSQFGPSVTATGDLGTHPTGTITVRLNAGDVSISTQ
jgi:hypothetical protein